jgi:hypothetical protein
MDGEFSGKRSKKICHLWNKELQLSQKPALAHITVSSDVSWTQGFMEQARYYGLALTEENIV